jgi:hypothetical protein
VPLYLWNGILLINNGALAAAEACCCDESGGDCPPCCDCAAYTFTLDTLTGGGSCADGNGDYTINLFGACDQWNGGNGFITAAMIKLPPGTGTISDPCGVYRLTVGPIITGASEADYEAGISDWDCHGCNTMVKTRQTGTCSGWPDTLEVCCAS